MPSLKQRWEQFILRGFRSGFSLYADLVKSKFQDGWRWLDAGGGWHVFCDLYDGERELVARASRAVVCDTNEESLAKHVSMSERVCSNLVKTPFADRSFDLITTSMVVEHLPDPAGTFKEMARILDWDGTMVIHTVNFWSYATMLSTASHIVPLGLRKRIISMVTSREEDDIFPTLYRCNTNRSMRRQLREAGLELEELRFVASSPIFQAVPVMRELEALIIRLTMMSTFGRFRSQLLVIARKRRGAERGLAMDGMISRSDAAAVEQEVLAAKTG